MPQTPNARVSFGDILQACQDKLLADGVVTDAAQVTWGTPTSIPHFTAPFDILLVARNGTHHGYDGAAADLRMRRMIDVYYRSEAIRDPGGGWKSWLIETFAKGDSAINSIGNNNFWPADVLGNLLTIESIKLVGDAAPEYPAEASVFGDYVCTLEANYYPAVDPARGP